MKKLLVLLAGACFSLNVMAADDSAVMFTSDTTVTNDAGGCSLLSEPVRMNLSNNVLGSYGCNLNFAIIGVATCHVAGRKKNWEEPIMVDSDNDPNTPLVDSGASTTVYGGRAYATSSVGGSMMERNTTTCVEGGDITAVGAYASVL